MGERNPEGWGQKVAGRCPACGSSGTLFVAAGQHVTCSLSKCPDPSLVGDFLDMPGPACHVVEFSAHGWHIEHTLRCRLDGLADCPIHAAVAAVGGPVFGLGRFEAWLDDAGMLHVSQGADGG